MIPAVWPMVTTTSAPAKTSSVTDRAKAWEVSIPSSVITVRTAGSIWPWTAVPAECTETRPPESTLVCAAAICPRPPPLRLTKTTSTPCLGRRLVLRG